MLWYAKNNILCVETNQKIRFLILAFWNQTLSRPQWLMCWFRVFQSHRVTFCILHVLNRNGEEERRRQCLQMDIRIKDPEFLTVVLDLKPSLASSTLRDVSETFATTWQKSADHPGFSARGQAWSSVNRFISSSFIVKIYGFLLPEGSICSVTTIGPRTEPWGTPSLLHM